MRKDFEELKTSIISENEPLNKVFIFNENGLTTTESLTVADVEAYSKAHPHTHIVRLFLKDYGGA